MFITAKKQKCCLFLSAMIIVLLIMTVPISADDSKNKTDAISSAGGRIASTNFETVHIVGQSSPTDVIESSNFREIGGFLASFGITAKFDISGTIIYDATSRLVSGCNLDLTYSSGTGSETTDANGFYVFGNVSKGTVQIEPSKDGDLRDAITGSDALFVLQYLAFLASMNDEQQFAGDVTKDGNVTGSDAQAILRYLAFYTDNIGSTSKWRFIPSDTSFTLQTDAIADFKGYLLGDANLSWGSSAALAKATEHSSSSVVLADPMKINSNELRIPIVIENKGEELNTLLFSLEFDSTVLNYKSANLTSLSQQFMMVANGTQGGKVHIAMAGVKGIAGIGSVLNLIFEVTNETDQTNTQLHLTRVLINDLSPVNLASVNIDFNTLKVGIPKQFDLLQNYPNPFNPKTVIEFQLPKEAPVQLRIFNLLGQQIRTLVDEQKEAGYHQVKWDGKDASGKEVTSGMYIYAIEAGDFRMTKKMVKMQ